ncbi:MAG: PilZ domain-containing protein [Planctomycetes bacterium]|nr:PilZ domain-containing protein [Planctomycetota bacterium]
MSDAYLDCAVRVTPVEEASHHEVEEAARRANERRSVEGVSTSVRKAGFHRPGPFDSVRVLDVGSGGISFESPDAISTGQKVELLIDTPVRSSIPAAGRVKYCIRWADCFRVGVEFVDISTAHRRMLTREFFELPD